MKKKVDRVDNNKKAITTIINEHKNTFNKELLELIPISDPNKEMTWDFGDEEFSVNNPYSVIACFVLYVYSLEFSDPPFYDSLNDAVRSMDIN